MRMMNGQISDHYLLTRNNIYLGGPTIRMTIVNWYGNLKKNQYTNKNIDALYLQRITMETWCKQDLIEQLLLPHWSTSSRGKDVCSAACLEIFIGQKTNRHCFFFFFLKNKTEMTQANTANNRGAYGSSSANKHLRKEGRVKAFPE